MKQLPNGLTVFNATPHPLDFWEEGWHEPVTVESDQVINAKSTEEPVSCLQPNSADWSNVWFVETTFYGDEKGEEIIKQAIAAGADVIVGSVIAAQAYPGKVVCGIPAPGFERVPVPLPAEVVEALEETNYVGYPMLAQEMYTKYTTLPTKRIRPDKFTIFPS